MLRYGVPPSPCSDNHIRDDSDICKLITTGRPPSPSPTSRCRRFYPMRATQLLSWALHIVTNRPRPASAPIRQTHADALEMLLPCAKQAASRHHGSMARPQTGIATGNELAVSIASRENVQVLPDLNQVKIGRPVACQRVREPHPSWHGAFQAHGMAFSWDPTLLTLFPIRSAFDGALSVSFPPSWDDGGRSRLPPFAEPLTTSVPPPAHPPAGELGAGQTHNRKERAPREATKTESRQGNLSSDSTNPRGGTQ